jgi:hypothetical protein
MFSSSGIIQYSENLSDPTSLRLLTDPDLSNYYRSLIPKWLRQAKPGYAPHISVVRKEIPADLSAWGKYEGEVVEFKYSNIIHTDGKYFWLNCFSYRLEEIRSDLGLPLWGSNHLVYYNQTWHITIGLIIR